MLGGWFPIFEWSTDRTRENGCPTRGRGTRFRCLQLLPAQLIRVIRFCGPGATGEWFPK
jgi:hypothetical protein